MAPRYWLLNRLEKSLNERFNEPTRDFAQIPQNWEEYPLSWLCFGEREVSIREDGPLWSDNDVMSDIIELFWSFYQPIIDYISEKKPGEKYDRNGIYIYVQPDYLNQSTILVVQGNKLVHKNDIKAWHLAFETPDELDSDLRAEYETISANID
jgi:hypothetical protein